MFGLFFRILINPLAVQKMNKCVFYFGRQDQRLDMAQRFFCQVKSINRIDDISWGDILLRRVRFIGRPGRELVKNRSDYWKRKFIGWLDLMVGGEISLYSLREQIFDNHGQNVLFSPAKSVADIYRVHLPHFNVVDINDERFDNRIVPFCFIAWLWHTKCADVEDGVTVFANPASKWNIKAYRLIHPNKKIIIRFHDRICDGLSIAEKRVFSIVSDLRKKHIIDGVESYYEDDAKRLGAVYRPNGVDAAKVLSSDVPYRIALYSFSGSPATMTEKNKRYLPLLPITEEVSRLYPQVQGWVGAAIATFNQKWVPYEEFLKQSALAEVYVDLYRMGPAEGFSYRIPEALWLNRKIISNRMLLQYEPFYSKDRIFLIGKDDISTLQSFLEKDIDPLPREILNQFDSRLWWTDRDPCKAELI